MNNGTEEKLLLPKYIFADITVFMRLNKEGEYLNLSDFIVTEEKNEIIKLESNADFVIMPCSFFFSSISESKVRPYICDISLNELLELAGIHDQSFFTRFKGQFGEHNELLAILCAKKIMDYRWGSIERQTEGGRYNFYRQGYTNGEEKKKKQKKLIFKKDFYKA